MHSDDAQRLLHELDDIRRLVRDQAADADRRAALTEDVVRALVHHRLLRLWIPRRYDGLELSLPDALEIYQTAARIDGSFGWAVMIGAGGGLFAAYLAEQQAEEIFGPAEAVIAGSGTPEGRAEQVPGGYRVQGRWRYASGAPYATTFTASCVVTQGGEPVVTETGDPLVRAMAFSRSDVEILETWNTTGMRATASHDFRVSEVFVPEALSFSVFSDTPREPGSLYRLPFQILTELPVLAVALGIARNALDAFIEIGAGKKMLGAKAVLAEDATAQATFAGAHAAWRLARDSARSLAERTWKAALAAQPISDAQLAETTAACVHAVQALHTATDELAAITGMTGIDAGQEFARARRDLQALRAHFSVSPRQLAAAGETLLSSGVDPWR